MLELKEVSKTFGGLHALWKISIEVKEGEIFGLIGPNGAGKTTLFNLITGVYRTSHGQTFFKGENITGLKPYQITRIGISRTFQNLRLFSKMTTEDNIKVAQNCICKAGLSSFHILNTNQERILSEERDDLLKLMGLTDRKRELAQNLSFGEQKRLELARALASRPDLLLLDEPAGGMNRVEVEELKELIFQIRSIGKTVFLVEHNMNLLMNVSNRIGVLNFGTKIAEGTPSDIGKDTAVIEAYLGKE